MYEVRSRRHPLVDDVVLTNPRGNVTETTIGNIVCRFGDRWVTPPVTDGLLPGVLRSELLAEEFISEESISIDRMHTADAIAVVNSVRGWRAASLAPRGDARGSIT
jgi:para-aminobenzoate synthetase / 4-amino-4-deoxychorismate lyase